MDDDWVQGSVLSAVMPLWSHPLLPTCCAPLCNMVVTTITSCLDSTLGPGAGPGAQPQPPAHAQPDPGLVQQIIEMGFSQPRAEEALRRVRGMDLLAYNLHIPMFQSLGAWVNSLSLLSSQKSWTLQWYFWPGASNQKGCGPNAFSEHASSWKHLFLLG